MLHMAISHALTLLCKPEHVSAGIYVLLPSQLHNNENACRGCVWQPLFVTCARET